MTRVIRSVTVTEAIVMRVIKGMLRTRCMLRNRDMLITSVVSTSANNVTIESVDIDVDHSLVMGQDDYRFWRLRNRDMLVISVVPTKVNNVAVENVDVDVDRSLFAGQDHHRLRRLGSGDMRVASIVSTSDNYVAVENVDVDGDRTSVVGRDGYRLRRLHVGSLLELVLGLVLFVLCYFLIFLLFGCVQIACCGLPGAARLS